MNEYQRLMQRYGLADAGEKAYSGQAEPTDTTDPAYASQLAAYQADKGNYDRYKQGYGTRVNSFDLYGGDWQGDTLQGPQYGASVAKTTRPVPQSVIESLAPTMGMTSGSGGYGVSGGGSGTHELSQSQKDFFDNETPEARDARMAGLTDGFLGNLAKAAIPGLGLITGAIDAYKGYNGIDANQSLAGKLGGWLGGITGGYNTVNGVQVRDAMGTPVTPAAPDAPDYNSADEAGYTQGVGENYGNDAYSMGPPSSAMSSSSSSDSDNGSSGADGNSGMAKGGLVRYAEGGAVERPVVGGGQRLSSELSDAIARDAQEQGITNPTTRFTGGSRGEIYGYAPDTVPAQVAEPQAQESNMSPLMEMYSRLAQQPSEYASERKAAQARSDAAQAQFDKLVEQQMAQPSAAGPSKAEMYFNLASAFGAPTKTGNFMDSLGNVSGVLAAHEKATREAESAGRSEKQKLGLSVAQARAQSAKEDASNLRSLMGEESRNKQAMSLQAMKEYYDSAQPKSDAGKAAADAGLKRGTPEFTAFVSKHIADKFAQSNVFKDLAAGVAQQNADTSKARLALSQQAEDAKAAERKKLTSGEMKLKTGTEDIMASTSQAFTNLSKALSLNDKTFGGSLADIAQRKALELVNPQHPMVEATNEMENLLGKVSVDSLKATFPGAISDAESKAILALQGIGAKSPEIRAKIINAGISALKSAYVRQKKRLGDIQAGHYRDTSPDAPTTPEGLE